MGFDPTPFYSVTQNTTNHCAAGVGLKKVVPLCSLFSSVCYICLIYFSRTQMGKGGGENWRERGWVQAIKNKGFKVCFLKPEKIA